jgi:cyclohexa-1,5-dienecarbonyl-CoA hydratase
MTSASFVRYVDDGQVARITLDRPPLNIMTLEVLEQLDAAIASAAGQDVLKVLVLAATGRAFSAGVAIEDHLGDRLRPTLETFHGIFRRLHDVECITIAAVQGAALGGGAELATFCDVVVASEAATFGQPEIKVGVFPPIAALHYPLRIGPSRALRLVLSGDILTAAEAERIGLVDHVARPDVFTEAVDAEIARYRSLSAAVLRLAKRAVREPLGLPFDEGLSLLEEVYHHELMSTADAEEGLRAFVEKRQPIWKDR